MRGIGYPRRDLLTPSAALAATTFAAPLRAAAPEASPVTPGLIEAARKEGKVVWYAAMDLPVSERVARGFEARYPGIAVRIERTCSHRHFHPLPHTYPPNIFSVPLTTPPDPSPFLPLN